MKSFSRFVDCIDFFVYLKCCNGATTKTNTTMKNYLINLIEEKGQSLDSEIQIEGHFGLTYGMLVDFICEAKQYHGQIRNTLVAIDFKNGDVFHYLNHLANGMVKSLGY